MRIVGGEHHIIVAKPFHKVSNRVFLRFNRNKAIALEEFRWLLRQFYFEPSCVIQIMIIQPPEQPRSPTTICFQKTYPQLWETIENTAGSQAYSRRHGAQAM